ncbi:MAG: ABC transporter permease [Spirochaetaceae bacterium]|jgi:peptide/nickel transport system permease protein|nr:ABC transporter permease [Spirochaetaceae bacterium]
MGHILKTAFKSGKFRFGFTTISLILLIVIFYPVFVHRDPLKMEGSMFETPNLFEMMQSKKEADSGSAAAAPQDEAMNELMAQFGFTAIQKETPKILHLLGTDNFGRDVLTELVAGTRTSLLIGLMAGTIATIIGLSIGLLAGYVGGQIDNILTTVTNVFIVIPSFVILILISVSLKSRSFITTALVIGITAWPWTARSVRAQTTSLRNRDHVNLSKLSGHSMPRIIIHDILPYVASYVMMAFILQMASGILAEASLSMMGLGPQNVASLGLMMNWAVNFSALPNGAWWAFLPVVCVIALITFSLNLINSGLDQVFNPQIRS